MELFHHLFAGVLLFVYQCFDRIVIRLLVRPDPPGECRLFLPRSAGHPRHHQGSAATANRRLPPLGRRLRPQAQDSHGLGRQGRTQGRLRPLLAPPHGAPRPAWCLRHFQKPGAGPDLSLCPSFPPTIPTTASCTSNAAASRTIISTSGTKFSAHGPAGRIVFPLSNNLLHQWSFLYGKSTSPTKDHLP